MIKSLCIVNIAAAFFTKPYSHDSYDSHDSYAITSYPWLFKTGANHRKWTQSNREHPPYASMFSVQWIREKLWLIPDQVLYLLSHKNIVIHF